MELPPILVEKIVVYLSTKPFREVAQLISEIQAAAAANDKALQNK